jgi:hypothetical protein
LIGEPGKAKQGRGEKRRRKNKTVSLKFLKADTDTSGKRMKNLQIVGEKPHPNLLLIKERGCSDLKHIHHSHMEGISVFLL